VVRRGHLHQLMHSCQIKGIGGPGAPHAFIFSRGAFSSIFVFWRDGADNSVCWAPIITPHGLKSKSCCVISFLYGCLTFHFPEGMGRQGRADDKFWRKRGFATKNDGDVILECFCLNVTGLSCWSVVFFKMFCLDHLGCITSLWPLPRMKQYLSDQNFRREMLLYLPQGVFRDVADLVPTGCLYTNRVSCKLMAS